MYVINYYYTGRHNEARHKEARLPTFEKLNAAAVTVLPQQPGF